MLIRRLAGHIGLVQVLCGRRPLWSCLSPGSHHTHCSLAVLPTTCHRIAPGCHDCPWATTDLWCSRTRIWRANLPYHANLPHRCSSRLLCRCDCCMGPGCTLNNGHAWITCHGQATRRTWSSRNTRRAWTTCCFLSAQWSCRARCNYLILCFSLNFTEERCDFVEHLVLRFSVNISLLSARIENHFLSLGAGLSAAIARTPLMRTGKPRHIPEESRVCASVRILRQQGHFAEVC